MSYKLRSDITLWNDNSAFLFGRTGKVIDIASVTKSSRARIEELVDTGDYKISFSLNRLDDAIRFVAVAKKKEYVCHNTI